MVLCEVRDAGISCMVKPPAWGQGFNSPTTPPGYQSTASNVPLGTVPGFLVDTLAECAILPIVNNGA
jgi:hypothetical protein